MSEEILFKPQKTPTVADKSINSKVAFTSYKNHEHEDDDHIYQRLIKAQKELLKDMKFKSGTRVDHIHAPARDGMTLDEFWKTQRMSNHIWEV